MRASLLLLLLALAGCPSSNGGSDGGGGADLAVATVDDMATSGGSPFDLLPAANTGTITVSSANSAMQKGYNAGASFVMGVLPQSPACVLSYTSHCVASDCTIQSADAGSPPNTSTLVSGGTLTITGGTTPLSIMPMNGYYQMGSSTQALFSGGETLTVANSGAVAPASSTTLVAPSPPTVTTPMAVAGMTYTITRSNGFDLAWSGGGPGDVSILIQTNASSTQPGTKFGSVRCTFSVGDGHGTVPAAALAVLPTGPASFLLNVIDTASINVNDWLMNVSAYTSVLAPNGDPFVGGQATVN